MCSEYHRLHPQHTDQIESDVVTVAQQSEKICNSCQTYLSQLETPPFHCSRCNYTVCASCDRPQSHPVHPDHNLHLVTLTSPWSCSVCGQSSSDFQDKKCCNCEQCDFHVCMKCFQGVQSQLHEHILCHIDVRYVYHQPNGEWTCDHCHNNNGPGNYFPAHCQSCKYNFCGSCIKPWRSTFHTNPGHVLYKADSNLVYSALGGWRCDRCQRVFTSEQNPFPFHCSQCDFDLCEKCMNVLLPIGDLNAANSLNCEQCVMCQVQPKNVMILHRETSHICCCKDCALQLQQEQDPRCPICRAPIEKVIEHYNT